MTIPPPAKNQDDALLERYRKGDAEAFSEVYDRYSRGLHFYARQFEDGCNDADDLVQEAFVRLLDVPLASVRLSAQALLYSIVRNLAHDLHRKRRIRDRVHTHLAGQGAGHISTHAVEESVSSALAGVPLEQREIVILRIYSGFTFEEVSEVLGVPMQTVVSRYRAALGRLEPLLSTLRGEQ